MTQTVWRTLVQFWKTLETIFVRPFRLDRSVENELRSEIEESSKIVPICDSDKNGP